MNFAFCTRVLDKNKKQLRANVLLHFSTDNILGCYGIARKTTALGYPNLFYIAVSRSFFFGIRDGCVLNFLKTFMDINVSNKTTFATTSIVKQTDCNSCGICVCIAAEIICETAILNNKIDIKNFVSAPNILDYRYTMVYDLYRNSIEVDFL